MGPFALSVKRNSPAPLSPFVMLPPRTSRTPLLSIVPPAVLTMMSLKNVSVGATPSA